MSLREREKLFRQKMSDLATEFEDILTPVAAMKMAHEEGDGDEWNARDHEMAARPHYMAGWIFAFEYAPLDPDDGSGSFFGSVGAPNQTSGQSIGIAHGCKLML